MAADYAVLWIDLDGVAHTPASYNSQSHYVAWCTREGRRQIYLSGMHGDADAPEATCLWCIARRQR